MRKDSGRGSDRDNRAIRVNADRDEKKDVHNGPRSERHQQMHHQKGAADMSKHDAGKHEKDDSHSGADRNTTKRGSNAI